MDDGAFAEAMDISEEGTELDLQSRHTSEYNESEWWDGVSYFENKTRVLDENPVTVMAKWVPSGQTVNQQYYTEVLTKLHECVRRKRLELWRNGWILHQDNAPAHNALSGKQFLANKNITVLEHPPYSPDLTPCDFYLFPKIKSVLKGTHFVSVEDVKAKTAEILNSLTDHDLRNCSEHWQHRMQLCVNLEGNYFEGDHS